MNRFDILLIRFILKWYPPESRGSFSLEDQSSNFAFVNIWSDAPAFNSERIRVTGITNDKVVGKQGSGNNVTDIEVPVAEITNAAYKIILHKKGWNLHYSSLLEAAFNLSGWFYVRRFTQAIYNRRLSEYDDQIGVLKAAQSIKKARIMSDDDSINEILTGNVPLSCDAMLKRLYGDQITLSPMYYPYCELLEQSVMAWIESGEMARASENSGTTSFVVTPKALNTLAEHQLNMRKHDDSVRPAKIAAGAAVIVIIVTLAQLYLAFTDDDEPPTIINRIVVEQKPSM